MLVSCVHPFAILRAAFCTICSLLLFAMTRSVVKSVKVSVVEVAKRTN